MNVSVTDISPSQKKIRVAVPASKVQEEIEGKYRDLAKNVKIKGFRPGKVPRSIIKSYYGKAVEQEVTSQFIQETYPEALKETDLKPLTQADVSEPKFEDDGSFSYTALVDVCPPFDLPEFKGLKLYKAPVEISETLVDAELERLRERQAQVRAVETERPVRDGDVAVVDFTPTIDGKLFEKGKTEDFMVEIGKGSLHPDFDKNLIGHNRGDNFSFELDYAENAPTPEIAGKHVLFDVTIKDIKEKEVPELNDDFALSVGTGQFETLDALKEEIRTKLREREDERVRSTLREQIVDKLLEQIQFEVPPRAVEAEADRMVQNLKHQFESQGLNFDTERLNAPEYKTGYRMQAERDIRTRLILDKIAQSEGLSLDFAESEELYRDIGKSYGMDPEKIKAEFEGSAMIEQLKERKLEDKVLNLIETEAVFVDTPEEAGQRAAAEQGEGAESSGQE
ncbi:MAG: trigger factor [Desulfobacteraceae bacterium]|nr:trigger factor [Desulfobacteraceae bacterium]